MKNEGKNLSQVSGKPVRPSASQEDQSRFRTWWNLSKKLAFITAARYSWARRAIRVLFSSGSFPCLIRSHRLSGNVAHSIDLASFDGIPPQGFATRISFFGRGLSPANQPGSRRWSFFLQSTRCVSGGIMGNDGHYGHSEYRLQREGVPSFVECCVHGCLSPNRGSRICDRVYFPDSHRGISESMDRRCYGIELAFYPLVDDSAMAYHLPLYATCHQSHLLLGPKY